MAVHIVELYGLPGVGKSTYAKNLEQEGYVSVAIDRSRLTYLRLALQYPRATAAWMIILLRNAWRARSYVVFRYDLSVFFVSLQQIDGAKKIDAQKVVLEEALVQRFLSLSYLLHTPKKIERLLRITPTGNMLLHVNHRQVTKHRYRDTHPRRQVGGASFATWQSHMLRNLETMQDVLESKGLYKETAD